MNKDNSIKQAINHISLFKNIGDIWCFYFVIHQLNRTYEILDFCDLGKVDKFHQHKELPTGFK